MKMVRGESKVDLTDAFDAAVAGVPSEYVPLIRSALEVQAGILSVPLESVRQSESVESRSFTARNRIKRAEVFVKGNEILIVRLSENGGRMRRLGTGENAVVEMVSGGSLVLAYSIGPDMNRAELDAFRKLLEPALGVELSPHYYQSEEFDRFREEGRDSAASPEPETIRAARTLADRSARTLATSIKSSSGLLKADTYKQLPGVDKEAVDRIIDELERAALVASEFVVVCSRTSTQVMRVPDASLLPKLDKQGIKCPCGRKLSEETCSEALSITNLGRSTLDKSAWMTTLLIQELTDLGVPLADILIDQQAGGDEMDCIASISGDMVLFELKDKPFNLGNAYSFGAKIGILRPRISVVITTEHVGADAKDHFERAQQANSRVNRYTDPDEATGQAPTYIEGLDSLRSSLESLITTVTLGDAQRVLGAALPFASLSPTAVLQELESRSTRRVADSASAALPRS